MKALWERLFTSKKLSMAVAGIIWVLFSPWLQEWGITEEQINAVLATAIAYIVGQGIADVGKEAPPKK